MYIYISMYIYIYACVPVYVSTLHIWNGLKLEHHEICFSIMIFQNEVAISKSLGRYTMVDQHF